MERSCGAFEVRKAARDKKAVRDTFAEGNTSKDRFGACSYCRIGKKAVGDAAADPKKNRVQADKDNTLKGVAERLKSVKPHVTKKAPRKALLDVHKCFGRSRIRTEDNPRDRLHGRFYRVQNGGENLP